MRFKDRADAGRRLAEALAAKYANRDGIVYALPRGGVVLGAAIAQHLHLPLDLMIARKIGHPHNPEYAIGAVTEAGELVRNPHEAGVVPNEWFQRQAAIERQEARRRHEVYLGGREPLAPTDKIAIIVDDGIATGLTMEAAIRGIKRQRPREMIVAVPVVPADTAEQLMREVDDVVALDVPDNYLGAVGAYYEDFRQVSDDEVVAALESARAPQ